MQVVLRKDMDKVGKRGDIVSVADGFARNYLIPRGHAIKATEGITAQATAMRASRDRADVKNREAAQVVATKLSGVRVRIEARAGSEGKLFGSVTNPEIVELVQQQAGIEIDRRQIELHEPIRTVGIHTVPVRLHSEVHVDISVEVAAAEQ